MQITQAAKIQASLEGLKAWHNAAIKYPENYNMTFTQFYQCIDRSNPVWRENFGDSVILTQEYLGFAAVEAAMEKLADSAEGRVSQYADGTFRGSEFYDALQGKVLTWDVSRIKIEGTKLAENSVDALKKVGVFGAWALSGVALAYIAVGALVIYSYRKA